MITLEVTNIFTAESKVLKYNLDIKEALTELRKFTKSTSEAPKYKVAVYVKSMHSKATYQYIMCDELTEEFKFIF